LHELDASHRDRPSLCAIPPVLSFHTLLPRLPRASPGVEAGRTDFLTLQRACSLLCFHTVTNCKFSISFLLTFIQNAGGVGGTFSPFGVQLRTLHPGCIFGTCGRSNVQTFRRCYLSCFHPLPHSFAVFCTFLHSPKIQLFCFQAIPHSLAKRPGGIDIHERVPKNGFSFSALRHSHRPQ
jgi:hypothetical protein